MKRLIAFAVFLFLTGRAFAQESSAPPQAAPSTKLEQLLSGKDRVLTKEFFLLGTLPGSGGQVQIEAVVLTDATNERSKVKGIRIDVKEMGRLERTHGSFLDIEEIADLAKSLTYFGELASKWAFDSPPAYLGAGVAAPPTPTREATFTSRGEFQVGVFRSASGSQGAVLQSGAVGRTSVAVTIPDLPKLKEMIDRGSVLLKAIP